MVHSYLNDLVGQISLVYVVIAEKLEVQAGEDLLQLICAVWEGLDLQFGNELIAGLFGQFLDWKRKAGLLWLFEKTTYIVYQFIDVFLSANLAFAKRRQQSPDLPGFFFVLALQIFLFLLILVFYLPLLCLNFLQNLFDLLFLTHFLDRLILLLYLLCLPN